MSNEVDRNLIHDAQMFFDSANVHQVRAWIFCYETSLPNSPSREWYEKVLRNFVGTRHQTAVGA